MTTKCPICDGYGVYQGDSLGGWSEWQTCACEAATRDPFRAVATEAMRPPADMTPLQPRDLGSPSRPIYMRPELGMGYNTMSDDSIHLGPAGVAKLAATLIEQIDTEPVKGIDPKTGKPYATSAGRFMGWNTIFGRGNQAEESTRYMTRIWFGRLRLHIFHRPDNDFDPHDHPWDFWTFPFTSYVEEVTVDDGVVHGGYTETGMRRFDVPDGQHCYDRYQQVVPAFRWSFRPATHTHRVLGAKARLYDTRTVRIGNGWIFNPDRRIVTLVWRSAPKRKWGFLRHRDGRYCWTHWKEYVDGGGKPGPCE